MATWKPIQNPHVSSGFEISPEGLVRFEKEKPFEAEYHSSNGYDYILLMNDTLKPMLFPIDELLAVAFVTADKSLIGKHVKVVHMDGNNRNNNLCNLRWVEDVEEWRPISDPDIEIGTYSVSSWGRVRNNISGAYVSSVEGKKYASAYLKSAYGNGHVFQRAVNRLVAAEFINGHTPTRCIVNHIDGDKLNNNAKNLEWVSYSENTRHAYMIGLASPTSGEKSGSAKITKRIAEKVWLLLIDDASALNGRPPTKGSPSKVFQYIKTEFPSVTIPIISKIKQTQGWGGEIFGDFKFHNRITPEMAKIIWLMLNDDSSVLMGRPMTHGSPMMVQKYLTEDGHNVSLQRIYSIKGGYAWGNISGITTGTRLGDSRKVISEAEAMLIWRLLNDDIDSLQGRPPTYGSPLTVAEYVKTINPNINEDIVGAIKNGYAWNYITGLPNKRKTGR